MTPHAQCLIIRTLSERPLEAITALELAIRKGWQDVNWQWTDNALKKSNGSSAIGDRQDSLIRL